MTQRYMRRQQKRIALGSGLAQYRFVVGTVREWWGLLRIEQQALKSNLVICAHDKGVFREVNGGACCAAISKRYFCSAAVYL